MLQAKVQGHCDCPNRHRGFLPEGVPHAEASGKSEEESPCATFSIGARHGKEACPNTQSASLRNLAWHAERRA